MKNFTKLKLDRGRKTSFEYFAVNGIKQNFKEQLSIWKKIVLILYLSINKI